MLSLGNVAVDVEVDSVSDFSVVDSVDFTQVVEEIFIVVVGLVTSGGHGLNFVVLLTNGRVVRIDENVCRVLSEVDEKSVDEDEGSTETISVVVDDTKL